MFFFFLFLGIFFQAYFVTMSLLTPATFTGTFFCFAGVWFLLSVICFVLALLKRLNLCFVVPTFLKTVYISVFSLGFVLSCVVLFFICHPKLADGTEEPEYVIFLGGGITKDRELSANLQRRIQFAAKYLKEHPSTVCVVTGGKGPFSPCPESDVLKPALEACGIASERIIPEPEAKDTIQNFQLSAKLLSQYSGRPVEEILSAPITVITNDFHISRAEILAKRMGFNNIYGACAKTPFVFRLNVYVREICCYFKLYIRILLTGKPEKL